VSRARVRRVDPRAPEADIIDEAAATLIAGGLVAFPTETVYGLGANALDAAAVHRIFTAKGRPATDPVIVHLADASLLSQVAREIPSRVSVLAREFWPGPLSIVLEKQPSVPPAVTAGLGTVAVRVPSHPVARRLLERSAIPVAAPSANRFSGPSPTTAEHVLDDLGDAIDLVLDAGAAPIGVESTILDLTVSPPMIRRPGGVPVEAIRTLFPDLVVGDGRVEIGVAQPSPGQLVRHYAPRARLTLFQGASDVVVNRIGEEARTAASAGHRVGVLAPAEDLSALAPRLAAAAASGRVSTAVLGTRRAPEQSAHELFAALRALDAEGVDVILAAAPAEGPLTPAVVDRLTRAAEGRVVIVRN
jgi:L-threonylcarbamoyladenylate synthase